MAPFFLTFLAVALAMAAGREAVLISRLAAAGASHGLLLALAGLVALGACALAAWLAGAMADALAGLIGPQHQIWLVSAALALAALEVLFIDAPPPLREPTRSLGAAALVLFAGVLADATGLLVIAFSLATGAPVLAAAGGGLAAAMVLVLAAIAGADWEKLPRRLLRWAIGLALIAGAFATAIFAPQVLS